MLRTLVNVEPNNEIRTMEEVFERFFGQPTRNLPTATTLPVDITEREGSLFVKAAVPGISPENLEVTVENNVLSIRGETRHESSGEQEKIYRREVSYGSFSRSIRLPEKLDLQAVSAEFNHGMVTIKIPRLPEAKPEVVKVSIKDVSKAGGAENAPSGSALESNNN